LIPQVVGEARRLVSRLLLRLLYALLTASKYLLEVEYHPLYYEALEEIDSKFYLQIATK
jgi:hypothetical protein